MSGEKPTTAAANRQSRNERRNMLFLEHFFAIILILPPMLTLSQHLSRRLQVLRRVDAERHTVNDRHVDRIPASRRELLQPSRQLQR